MLSKFEGLVNNKPLGSEGVCSGGKNETRMPKTTLIEIERLDEMVSKKSSFPVMRETGGSILLFYGER